jgi:hypothetical protein
MSLRKLLAWLALAGSVAAAIVFRRRSRGREHLDVYFEDGTMLSFREGSPEAATVLPLAHRILETAQP